MNRKELVGWGAVAAFVAALLMWDHHRFNKPVVTENPVTHTVTVEVPKITEKVVTQYVTDPSQARLIDQLLAENKRLKQQVVAITSSTAENKTEGGIGQNGGMVALLPQTTLVTEKEPLTQEYEFSDYQLKAKYSSKPSFTYNLDQKFRIITETSVDKEGSRNAQVRLFQAKPDGANVEIPTETTAIFSNPNRPHFMVSPRIQGGIGVTNVGKTGFGSLQWLKYGRTPAAEDLKWAFLSPALTRGGLTLQPISFNLGSIRHNPFTNIWLGPTVDLNKNVGIVFSATF